MLSKTARGKIILLIIRYGPIPVYFPPNKQEEKISPKKDRKLRCRRGF